MKGQARVKTLWGRREGLAGVQRGGGAEVQGEEEGTGV